MYLEYSFSVEILCEYYNCKVLENIIYSEYFEKNIF